nr:spondin domain-containing protein [Sphingomonas quercus]
MAIPAVLVAAAVAQPAFAQRKVTVTVQNIAPPTSVGVAPLNVGFSGGTFDAFDQGGPAAMPIVTAAELGSGTDWLSAFAAADPAAVLGTVGGAPMPPGEVASATFTVDPATNPFFSFAAMVVPSNDSFIGNDDPHAYRLFDAAGNLLISSITQTAGDIWDAGSELFNPANAAYIAGADATLRDPENGTVSRSFADFSKFNGLTTAPGYSFNSGLSAETPFYRITFSAAAVPEPATWAMMMLGFGLIGAVVRKDTRFAGAATA